jgi:hypothetical protein
MKANGGTRKSLRAPVLLAAAAGIALSASGCIIDSSSNGGCSPDLTISWRILGDLTNPPTAITCAEAGGADTVIAVIDGGGLPGPLPTEFTSPCPSNSISGSFVAELPTTGVYNISVELWSATILSETPLLTKTVDCSGLSATPIADLHVNF